MKFNNDEFGQGEDERLKFAYFEFDLEYISVPRKRFENLEKYFIDNKKERIFNKSEVYC